MLISILKQLMLYYMFSSHHSNLRHAMKVNTLMKCMGLQVCPKTRQQTRIQMYESKLHTNVTAFYKFIRGSMGQLPQLQWNPHLMLRDFTLSII